MLSLSYLSLRAKASIGLHELLPESQQDAMKDLEKKANGHTGIARQWQGLLQGTLGGNTARLHRP